MKCIFESHNRRKQKKTKIGKCTKNGGFLPRPEVTSLSRDYFSLKVTKYFTDILSMPALFYAESAELLATAAF